MEESQQDTSRYSRVEDGEKPDPEHRVTQVEENIRTYLVQKPERTRHGRLRKDAHDLQHNTVNEDRDEKSEQVDPVPSD
jgi:hypothetical protein